ncbi:amidohydrolase [Metallosphaera sedula]|uniref:Amidohydrolase n=3 Tax=Metallosphaera TaxID=41980 RepID=A4YIB4_METS5|nr:MULTISPECIES: amidohydrolase [Metallosphaera]ABP96166.1 amidohydrolase [Metallosphaera sedula DSM 5348]AIM28149.1 amidohydrolase [Metallosphaera sedula]AKV74972.1 N-ethylammeline chlorohydrolase [Metallosphaera sedula]AKV77210.1 N-ethylammeline chlorohydrolase [Metallosphaera sedula]AKV79460.1 N-ethylammeline chlorohydrolase [Metallosphaera sedula]
MGVSNRTYTLRNCAFAVDYSHVEGPTNIVVEDGFIKHVGKEVEGDELECSEYVVMPGLVNAHTHSAMTVLRGVFDDGELHEWLARMWDEERKLTREIMAVGSEIAVIEMISSGTTAFVDMYFNPDQIRDISTQYGIRARAGPTLMKDKSVDETVRELRALGESEFFRPIVNVHSLYATDLQKLRELRDNLNRGYHLHIHLSETREEVFQIKRRYGMFPVELIHREGLTERVHGVHLGWITSWELNYLRSSIAVTHCPTSNMKLATGGAFPMKEALTQGLNVTIGTDGAASNNSLNMFQEMKMAVLLQRHNYWSTGITAVDVFRASSVNGYKMLGIRGGEIRPGYVADLVLLSKYEVYPLTKERLLSHLVYNPPKEVEKVIIQGKIVYQKNDFRDRLKKLLEKLSLYL